MFHCGVHLVDLDHDLDHDLDLDLDHDLDHDPDPDLDPNHGREALCFIAAFILLVCPFAELRMGLRGVDLVSKTSLGAVFGMLSPCHLAKNTGLRALNP